MHPHYLTTHYSWKLWLPQIKFLHLMQLIQLSISLVKLTS